MSMHEELFPYYESELQFLRRFGAEFARSFPDAAKALKLEPHQCTDPHVERLLEGVALLTGRIKRKLDDEFPEFTDSLLSLLYPHFTAPVPAVGIVQFQVDPQAVKLTAPYTIARETMLNSAPIQGVSCQFKTCYPVTLLPIAIESVKLYPCSQRYQFVRTPHKNSKAILTLKINTLGGVTFGEIILEKLRLFLHGAPLSYRLYELLGNEVDGIQITNKDIFTYGPASQDTVTLPAEALCPVGFNENEALFPFPKNTFSGYRLLQEFFVFAEKFLFYDINFEDFVTPSSFFPNDNTLFINIYLSSMFDYDQEITTENFLLGCTPVINLFKKSAEPCKADPAKSYYKVIPETHKLQGYEVYSVDKVEEIDLTTGKYSTLEPFYDFRHTLKPETSVYWYTHREPDLSGASDVYVHLCSLGYEKKQIYNKSLSFSTTCTNRNLVRYMPRFDDNKSDFTANNIPFFGPVKIVTLKSEPVRTPLGRDDEYWNAQDDSSRLWRGGQWRLISHFSLNHLSIQKGGIEALQALLQLYDVYGADRHENVILGLKDISTKPITRIIGGALCRGINIELVINVNHFKESTYYLFTAILERFFSLYASINSFTCLTVINDSEKRSVLKQWPIRAGEQIII